VGLGGDHPEVTYIANGGENAKYGIDRLSLFKFAYLLCLLQLFTIILAWNSLRFAL
jgi:hypothetical protein